MLGSLFTAVSGLNANSLAMSVIGDNVANTKTVGFKSNRAFFSSLLSASLGGATSVTGLGGGVQFWGSNALWTQGSLETTNSPTDLAIYGNGLFVMRDPETNSTFFTRAGVFSFDKEGRLVNPDGLIVRGFKVRNDGTLGSIVDIQIPSGNMSPNPTTQMTLGMNLDASQGTGEGGAKAASVTIGEDNAALTYTAVKAGTAGNGIKIEYLDDGSPLGFSFDDSTNTITVHVEDGVTTAQEILDAFETAAPEEVKKLVSVAKAKGSDGTGAVEAGSFNLGGGQDDPNAAAFATGTLKDGSGDLITYTAVTAGKAGNDIKIVYEGGSDDSDPSVAVDGNTIKVTLSTVSSNNTVEKICNAINGDDAAKALVKAEVAEGKEGEEVSPGETQLAGGKDGAEIDSAFTTSITAYDSLGTAITITFDFTKTGSDTWNWETVCSDSGATCTGSGELKFDEMGKLVSPTENPVIKLTGLSDGAADMDITWKVKGNITNYAGKSTLNAMVQDGYPTGSLQNVYVDENGHVTGVYSNSKLVSFFQIAMADFPNLWGLNKIGKNLYQETLVSGQPLYGTAGTGRLGNISPSSIEMSNADLATEFVNLITTQRSFQANSKVITVSDEILQELINMKR